MIIQLKKRNEGQRPGRFYFRVRTRARGIQRASLAIAVCWFLFDGFPAVPLLNAESMEYPVKLAALYNFVKFIEWPIESYSDPGAPFTICVVGHDPFGPVTEQGLRTRKAGTHPIAVLTLKPTEPLNACHMVFIPVTEKEHIRGILTRVKGLSILTVGESEGFAAVGGVINMTVENGGLQFEINRVAVERAHLNFRAQLLRLAKIVTDKESGRKN